ncbi:hypothetical protein JCM10212_003187 [Sporobolomyces blumeae]
MSRPDPITYEPIATSEDERRRAADRGRRCRVAGSATGWLALALVVCFALVSLSTYRSTFDFSTLPSSSAPLPSSASSATFAPDSTTADLIFNMSKAISPAEVANHKSADSAWVIIEGNVYDVTEFLEDHPGGKKVLLNACGQDSTEKFWQFHSKKILEKTAKQFLKAPVAEGSKL